MRIAEQHIKSGYFWLPSQPENKIPGTLKIYDGGKIELEIIGNFNNDLTSFRDILTLQRIVGHIEKEGYVTLDACSYKEKSLSFGGISKSLLYIDKVLSGAHYEENEELTFSTFQFSVEGLDEWLSICGIKVDHDFSNQTASINYEVPPEISFMLNNGLKLSFTFSWTLPGYPIFTEARITQKAYIKLSSEELRPLTDFTSTAYKITNFLCFALDETVSIRDVSVTSSELQTEISKGEYRPVSIKIFYRSLPFSETSPKINWHSMLFRFPQIKDNVAEIFNNWLNAYELIEPSFNLYFASKTGVHKYLNGKFLSLVQGLETYHRRTSDETMMEEKEYEALVSSILQTCPSDKQDWLSGRLKHGNEINLSARLKKVVEPFKEHIGSSRSRSKMIRSIVDTRNYFTHYDKSLKNDAANGHDLWVLCMKMEAIFQLHFLKELGFTDEQIKAVVNNSDIKRKLEESNKKLQ